MKRLPNFSAQALSLLGVLVLAAACSEETSFVEYQKHTVARGDMRITIRQRGTIEARDPANVQSPLFGRATILDMVPEGTLVKEGDWLFTLDVESQREKLLAQQISAKSAEQNLINARKQLEIRRQQNESDIKRAELNVLFADLNKKQYVEGDLPREQQTVEAEITLAKEELERARDTLNWSIQLEEKGFISTDKLKSDELAVRRRQIDQELAEKKKVVLDDYTSKKRLRELESEFEESRRELERVKTRAEASYAQRFADVEAQEAKYQLEAKKLARLEHQVANNVVHSPRDGIIIYAREGRGRDSKPIEPGADVREGQTVMTIPEMDRVLVDVDVHESSVPMVQLGLPVIVTTDTGETTQGEIEYVATVADSQSWWRNPDLKVYSTKVTIDNTSGRLRPGMNCYAEIIIEELDDVVNVPVQAVHSNGGQSFVYLDEGGQPALHEIKVGLNNTEFVHVLDGLEGGESIYLAVPPDAPPVPLWEGSRPQASIERRAAKKAEAGESKGKGRGARSGRGRGKPASRQDG